MFRSSFQLFIVIPIVCRSVCLVVEYLLSVLVFQSPRWGNESWLIYFSCLLGATCLLASVPCLFLTVPWVGLQCKIVIFSGHTYSLFAWNYEYNLIIHWTVRHLVYGRSRAALYLR